MKSTETFKRTIEDYLKERAENDQVLADKMKNESKNMDECIDYILTQVQKSGCNGFTDDEIYSMAIHYWDEEKESLGEIKKLQAQCVVNHEVKLTEEEIAEAKREAMEKVVEEQKRKLTAPKKTKKETKTEENQMSLF